MAVLPAMVVTSSAAPASPATVLIYPGRTTSPSAADLPADQRCRARGTSRVVEVSSTRARAPACTFLRCLSSGSGRPMPRCVLLLRGLSS